MADVRFQKPEVVISEPWVEISRGNLVCRCISTFLNRYRPGEPGSTFSTLWPPS